MQAFARPIHNVNTCTFSCAVGLLLHKTCSMFPKSTGPWMARPDMSESLLQDKFKQALIFLNTPCHVHCTRGSRRARWMHINFGKCTIHLLYAPEDVAPHCLVQWSSQWYWAPPLFWTVFRLDFGKIRSGCFSNFLQSCSSCYVKCITAAKLASKNKFLHNRPRKNACIFNDAKIAAGSARDRFQPPLACT